MHACTHIKSRASPYNTSILCIHTHQLYLCICTYIDTRAQSHVPGVNTYTGAYISTHIHACTYVKSRALPCNTSILYIHTDQLYICMFIYQHPFWYGFLYVYTYDVHMFIVDPHIEIFGSHRKSIYIDVCEWHQKDLIYLIRTSVS